MLWVKRDAPVQDAQELAVLYSYAEHANPDGTSCYPSIATVACDARCSISTAQRKVKALLSRGVLRYGDQELVSHFRADRRPVVYNLAMELRRTDVIHSSQVERGVNVTPRDPNGVSQQPPRGVKTSANGVSLVTDKASLNQKLKTSSLRVRPHETDPVGAGRVEEGGDSHTTPNPIHATPAVVPPPHTDPITAQVHPIAACLKAAWDLTVTDTRRLLPHIQAALTKGWEAPRLTQELVTGVGGAVSPYAVLVTRLRALGEPPQEPPRSPAPAAWCPECSPTHPAHIPCPPTGEQQPRTSRSPQLAALLDQLRNSFRLPQEARA